MHFANAWTIWLINFFSATLIYICIFYILFRKILISTETKIKATNVDLPQPTKFESAEIEELAVVDKEQPNLLPTKDKKDKNPIEIGRLYATNFISSINAFICSFVGFASLVIEFPRLIKRQNFAVIKDMSEFPWILFMLYAYLDAYLFADALSNGIILIRNYKKFNKRAIYKIREAILHHLPALLPFIIQIPQPIYCWAIFIMPAISEFSTIFLNFKWFSKYYKCKNVIRRWNGYLFIISWFAVRMVAWYTAQVLIIYYFDVMWAECGIPITLIGTIVIALWVVVQSVWAYKIVRIVCRKLNITGQSTVDDIKSDEVVMNDISDFARGASIDKSMMTDDLAHAASLSSIIIERIRE